MSIALFEIVIVAEGILIETVALFSIYEGGTVELMIKSNAGDVDDE